MCGVQMEYVMWVCKTVEICIDKDLGDSMNDLGDDYIK